MKDQHRKELDDLTKSFLAQKSGEASQSDVQLQNQVLSLQSQLEDDRARHQQDRLQLEELQKQLEVERSRHRSEIERVQAVKASSQPIQNGPSEVSHAEADELRRSLEQERRDHEKVVAELNEKWRREKEELLSQADASKQQHLDSLKVGEAEKAAVLSEVQILQKSLSEEREKSRGFVDEERPRWQKEVESLKSRINEHVALLAQVKSENDSAKHDLEARIEQLSHSLQSAVDDKNNADKMIEDLKQQLVVVQAQVGESESSQVQSLVANLQEQQEKHRRELDDLRLKMSEDHGRVFRDLESELGRQRNQFEAQSQQTISESDDLKNQLESLTVEKSVIEMSLEQLKLEFSDISESFALSEKNVSEERNRLKVSSAMSSN